MVNYSRGSFCRSRIVASITSGGTLLAAMQRRMRPAWGAHMANMGDPVRGTRCVVRAMGHLAANRAQGVRPS